MGKFKQFLKDEQLDEATKKFSCQKFRKEFNILVHQFNRGVDVIDSIHFAQYVSCANIDDMIQCLDTFYHQQLQRKHLLDPASEEFTVANISFVALLLTTLQNFKNVEC